MASRQSINLMQLLSRLLGRDRDRHVLPGYSTPGRRPIYSLLWMLAYMAVVAIYGILIALTGQVYLMVMAVPLVILALLIIWALPATENAPVRWITILLFGFLCALMSWPDYLALDVLGLPWITAVRLFAFPLAAVVLTCLSISPRFREELAETLGATPITWKLVAAFGFIAVLSVGFSADPGFSANRLMVALLYWIMIFFCAAWVFRVSGRAMKFAYLIWGFAVFVCLIGLWEWHIKALPWAGHIPSFLAVDDPVLQKILAAKSRSTTGIYRLQSKFMTPLSFAEFLVLATPVILFFAVYTRSALLRAGAMASVCLLGYCVFRTDSRLGISGFMLSFMMFILAWSTMRWRQVKGSIMGPAVTLAYPVLFAAFIAATIVIGRLRVMVWGGGAASFSTQAREEQVATGIPMILSRPWGRGIGRGARELGFVNPAGSLTIDSYFLQIGLEFGIIGFLVYYGMFVSQIIYSATNVLRARTMEQLLIIPFTIALINFVVIKTVLSQQDNHALVFAMLGVLTALIWRVKQDQKAGMGHMLPHPAADDRPGATA